MNSFCIWTLNFSSLYHYLTIDVVIFFFYQFLFQYFGTNCFLLLSQYLIFIILPIMVVETFACGNKWLATSEYNCRFICADLFINILRYVESNFHPVFDDIFVEDLASTVTCNSNKIPKWINHKVVFVKGWLFE
ncbi:hypothetical protein T10_5869 [Trichinella papuae]|uniref:Uncharacterized protein n=1 Tax=Trichinella papuae TaxID=268474 RepID=A0A0V1MW23_9BILA|nr:hypothetical protein T10_8011 [Trichinella papuae]KRZ75662.1 hypothetical protein T10_5869 [Trichinella papuae]